jgi:hypothetical protein
MCLGFLPPIHSVRIVMCMAAQRKAFVPDSKPGDRFDDPSSVQQHVRFYFFSTLTVLMLKLVDL